MVKVLARENKFIAIALLFVPFIPVHLASSPTPIYNWVTITIAFLLLIGLAALVWIRRENLAMEAEHLRRLVESLRLSEEAVRHSERRHREFVENALYGVFRTGDDGRFLDMNPAFVFMLGYSSKEELLALNLNRDVFVDTRRGALLNEQARQDGRLRDVEVQWRRKDGTHLMARLSGRAVSDCVELAGSGKLGGGSRVAGARGLECIVQDLTERKAMMSQIAALRKFEAIGQLAGGIAHDFNNVVGAIQSWAELAHQEAQPDSSLQRRLERLCNQTTRAAAMTRQMLAVSRQQIPESTDVSLNDIVFGVEGLLRNLIGPQIKVGTALAPDLENIWANQPQMEQVVMNLMLNARDAMPQGGRMIIETENQEFDSSFCRARSLSQSRFACLSVADTGCGMDPATREHIFEPFFTTKGSNGTGLGLATIDRIVRDHGGWIDVLSEVGQGTTFRVYLPSQPISLAAKAQEVDVDGFAPLPATYAGHETRVV